jgi:steroid delta-isomerase-like uncharacterized protein
MSTEDNKAIVLRNYEELNKGNLGIVDELYATNYVGHTAGLPEPVRGREALKPLLAAYFTAFPDLHETPEDLIAEGDKVAIRVTYRGTHKGDFQGLPPTGRQVQFTSIDIYRLAGGKIVEQWVEFDGPGMLQQLGVIPGVGSGFEPEPGEPSDIPLPP